MSIHTPLPNPLPKRSLIYGDIRLSPLSLTHADGLRAAAADGQLWRLPFTGIPTAEDTEHYIQTALNTRHAYTVFLNDRIVGSTSYHDILYDARRLEIGYTWYAESVQRSHVNTTCKFLLLSQAFEDLDVKTVGWRTDITNTRSQTAIERLGAKKDGVLRGNRVRKDGSIGDTVFYSMDAREWHTAKTALIEKLRRP